MAIDELQVFYRDYLKGRLRELETAGKRFEEAGDGEPLRRLSHTLKGSGLTFGHPRISEAAARAEEAVERGDTEQLRDLVETLRRAMREVAEAD